MAEILPRHYIIGIVMFTFMIVGGVSIFSIYGNSEPSFIQDEQFQDFNNSFNVVNDITKQVDDLEQSITEADTDFGLFGVLNALISSAWQALKLLFTSLSFMDGVFAGLTAVFGIPGWIPALIGVLVTVVLIFSIFSTVVSLSSRDT